MFDINHFSSIYRRTKRAAGETGALVRISFKPVSAKMLRVLTHVAVENQTTAFTKLRLGISNRGVDYFLDEIQNLLADELAICRSDVLLGDGDRFFAELTGTTTDDVVIVNLSGWEQDI